MAHCRYQKAILVKKPFNFVPKLQDLQPENKAKFKSTDLLKAGLAIEIIRR